MESFQIFEHINLVRLAIEYEFVALEGRVFDVLEGVYAFRWLCIHHQGLRVEVETVVENKKEENLYSHTATVVRSIVMKIFSWYISPERGQYMMEQIDRSSSPSFRQ